MPEKISVEEATRIVKNYFDAVKGKLVIKVKIESEIDQIPLIDFLDFNIISVEQVDELYVVECKFKEGIRSSENLGYRVELYKERGEIKEVKEVIK